MLNAFAPANEEKLVNGKIDIVFVPSTAESWQHEDQPGCGLLRLHANGDIELLKYTPSKERPNFRLSREDIKCLHECFVG